MDQHELVVAGIDEWREVLRSEARVGACLLLSDKTWPTQEGLSGLLLATDKCRCAVYAVCGSEERGSQVEDWIDSFFEEESRGEAGLSVLTTHHRSVSDALGMVGGDQVPRGTRILVVGTTSARRARVLSAAADRFRRLI